MSCSRNPHHLRCLMNSLHDVFFIRGFLSLLQSHAMNVFCLSLVGCFLLPSATPLVRRYHYEAQLSGPGGAVHFSRTKPEAWKNISKLGIDNSVTPSQICTYGRGSWLAYPEDNFAIKDYPFYYYLMGEQCIPADFVKSLQPLGDAHDPINQGMVVFPTEHFQGQGHLIVNTSYSKGPVGSIVFMGGLEFTLGKGGDAVCLAPVYWAQHRSPCLIPTLDSSFGFKSPVTSITPGCSEGAKVRTFAPQNCLSEGTHQRFADRDFSFKKMSSFCSGGKGDGDMKGKFGQVMEIWKGRVNHNLETLHSIKLPYGSEYKLRILDTIIKIFHNTCGLVQAEYLSILKNIYMIHLREAWTKDPELIGVEDDYWKHTVMFLDSCASHAQEGVDASDCEIGGLPDSPDQEPFADIVEIHDYDMVIEQMWLIFNQVTPYCNHLNSYRTNDWVNMVSLFRRAFFDPLSEQWYNPGAWRSIYTTMFHGFNMGMERRLMVTCLRKALSETPTYDPIGRTRFFLRKGEVLMQEVGGVGGGGKGTVPPNDDSGAFASTEDVGNNEVDGDGDGEESDGADEGPPSEEEARKKKRSSGKKPGKG